MSLKSFHLVFITAASALAFGFGIWLARAYYSGDGAMNLVFAILSFASSVGLIFYERYFLKKTKDVSFL